MLYPFTKLPYGLQSRFFELATPREAYELQLAAPDLAGLQPVMKLIVRNVMFIAFKNLYGHYFENHRKYNNCKKTYFRVTGLVKFRSFTELNDISSLDGQFEFTVRSVCFHYCKISVDFIQCVGKFMKVEDVTFSNCCFDSDVTRKTVSRAFDDVDRITTTHSKNVDDEIVEF